MKGNTKGAVFLFINCSIFLSSSLFWIWLCNIIITFFYWPCACFHQQLMLFLLKLHVIILLAVEITPSKVFPLFFRVLSFPLSCCLAMHPSHKRVLPLVMFQLNLNSTHRFLSNWTVSLFFFYFFYIFVYVPLNCLIQPWLFLSIFIFPPLV